MLAAFKLPASCHNSPSPNLASKNLGFLSLASSIKATAFAWWLAAMAVTAAR